MEIFKSKNLNHRPLETISDIIVKLHTLVFITNIHTFAEFEAFI